MKVSELTPKVRQELENKAKYWTISLQEYLNDTDKNYCIITEDGYILADEDGLVVYGSKEDASDYTKFGDRIITEEEAIKIMCNQEIERHEL